MIPIHFQIVMPCSRSLIGVSGRVERAGIGREFGFPVLDAFRRDPEALVDAVAIDEECTARAAVLILDVTFEIFGCDPVIVFRSIGRI
jgi:hypothetical protein